MSDANKAATAAVLGLALSLGTAAIAVGTSEETEGAGWLG